MKQYQNLFENIIMSGVVRRQSKFEGNITIFEGCGGFSDDGFTIRQFGGRPIRIKIVDGEPWFLGKDVADALGYTNTRKAIGDHVDEEDKTTVTFRYPGSNYKSKAVIINESGMYSLVLQSHLPDAKKFKQWITKEVLPSIRKTGGYGTQQLPDYMQRVILNAGQVPMSHFSVIGELFSVVYSAFERAGHRLSDKAVNGVRLRPDVSVGKCFSSWLKKNGYDPEDERITYEHKFPDGYSVNAYAYPNKMLGVFRNFIYQEWLPIFAPKYLKDKDLQALEYLPRLIGSR